MSELPSLMKVRQEHKLTSRRVAEVAGVPLRIEYLAEIGGLVEETEARLLLEALCNLTGKHYTLQHVRINVRRGQAV